MNFSCDAISQAKRNEIRNVFQFHLGNSQKTRQLSMGFLTNSISHCGFTYFFVHKMQHNLILRGSFLYGMSIGPRNRPKIVERPTKKSGLFRVLKWVKGFTRPQYIKQGLNKDIEASNKLLAPKWEVNTQT